MAGGHRAETHPSQWPGSQPFQHAATSMALVSVDLQKCCWLAFLITAITVTPTDEAAGRELLECQAQYLI